MGDRNNRLVRHLLYGDKHKLHPCQSQQLTLPDLEIHNWKMALQFYSMRCNLCRTGFSLVFKASASLGFFVSLIICRVVVTRYWSFMIERNTAHPSKRGCLFLAKEEYWVKLGQRLHIHDQFKTVCWHRSYKLWFRQLETDNHKTPTSSSSIQCHGP